MAIPVPGDSTADRLQVRLLRGAGTAGRFTRARSLSASVIAMARRAIRRRHPGWSEADVHDKFIAVHYGPELAGRARGALKQAGAMSAPDLIAAITPVIELFDALGVSYAVVGSVASSAHGIARSTVDADLVADLRLEHVKPIVDGLIEDYYIDSDATEDAVRRRAMFNVLHLATMLKVDVYVLTSRPFDRESFRRRQLTRLEDESDAKTYSIGTPEDTILHKLEWYRAGGEVSERQWGDVVGVLEVQAGALDLDYMRRWAADLGVDDLLERAIDEAGD